jgi:hypothetical protein
MIKPNTGDIGRRITYRPGNSEPEKHGVLLNMEPLDNPSKAKVLYDEEWEPSWTPCDDLDWVQSKQDGELVRSTERSPDLIQGTGSRER